jgi:small subunit ribosomal protein S21
MLVIKVKENESIDRALRRYKRKVKDTKLLQKTRANQTFVKPSERKKAQISKARYKQQLQTIANQ